MGAPYSFAWVDPSETTFGPEHVRYDETIFRALGDHSEGGKPTLTLNIKNPGVGLLAPGRKYWAWFGDTDPTGHPRGLFFGRLVTVPTNIIAAVCTIKLIGEPLDYNYQKQIQAEPLKVRPGYDPVLFSPAQRDNPDAILEGYARLWHVSRPGLVVQPSDILVGEDGTEVFNPTDSFYSSLKITMGQPPLQAVNVELIVPWTQSDIGIVDFGQQTIYSYTGGAVIAQFPKPEASLGGGWTVHSSVANDAYGINTAITASWTSNYTNKAATHAVGDTISESYSFSGPVLSSPILKYKTLVRQKGGVIDELDFYNPDDPTATYEEQTFQVPQWRVDTSLVGRYDAARQRSERVQFTLTANVQEILSPGQSPPLPAQETISLSAMDVSQRLENVLDWLSVRNQVVAAGQVIFPNNPTVPGGMAYQITVDGGTAGNVEPQFSSIVGEETNDNSVIWTSLGNTLGTSTPNWTASTFYPKGSVIRPLPPLYAPWTVLVPSPRVVGTPIGFGEICQASNGTYQICTLPGTTGRSEPAFGAAYGDVTIDETVEWTCIGSLLPDGTIYYVATSAGTSDEILLPNFNPTLGALTNDGTGLVWKSLGAAGQFVEIPIGDVRRRSYIPTGRGQWTLESAICRGVAKLALRSRAVNIQFDCRFERAVALSCRKNATIFDNRIPGGSATGKIINYQFLIDGGTREEKGNVTIGCCVGRGGSVTPTPGTPSYVEEGYVQTGYQYYYGSIVPLPDSSVGYSVPIDAPVDDGLVFPLDRSQVVVVDKIWGNLADQVTAINAAAMLLSKEALVSLWANATAGAVSVGYQQQLAALSRTTVDSLIEPHDIWRDLELKPVNNGPFNTDFQILTTPVELPLGYNSEAPAIP